MRRSHNGVLALLAAVALMLSGTATARTQEPPPEPRMLLNLDLFKARPSGTTESAGAGGSMFEQIRALSALGYLGSLAQPPKSAGTSGKPGEPDRSNPPITPEGLPNMPESAQ